MNSRFARDDALLLAVILFFIVNLLGRGKSDGGNVERDPFPFRDVISGFWGLTSGFVVGVYLTVEDFRHFGKTVADLKLLKSENYFFNEKAVYQNPLGKEVSQ